jgi:hypothetical protein
MLAASYIRKGGFFDIYVGREGQDDGGEEPAGNGKTHGNRH